MKPEDIAKIMNAFCDPTRLMVLREVFRDEKCVGKVAEALDLSVQNVSHHLRYLEGLGLVEAKREGKFIRYKARKDALNILKELKSFLET